MPVNDMLDVIHFYFEDDVLGEEEVQKAKQEMRQQIYEGLYERDYTWGRATNQQGSRNREFGTQEVGADPFGGPPKLEHKPYVPPTPVDPTSSRPYGTLIDPPLE